MIQKNTNKLLKLTKHNTGNFKFYSKMYTISKSNVYAVNMNLENIITVTVI